jgi:hypothetical protein
MLANRPAEAPDFNIARVAAGSHGDLLAVDQHAHREAVNGWNRAVQRLCTHRRHATQHRRQHYLKRDGPTAAQNGAAIEG